MKAQKRAEIETKYDALLKPLVSQLESLRDMLNKYKEEKKKETGMQTIKISNKDHIYNDYIKFQRLREQHGKVKAEKDSELKRLDEEIA